MTRILPILLFCLSGTILRAQVEIEKSNRDEQPLEIKYQDQIPDEELMGSYQAQDVLMVSDGAQYKVTFFVMYNDTLRSHSAVYKTGEVFDRAYYKWESDNKVAIRLHNSEFDYDKRFKVWGNGSTTGMQIQEE